MRKKIINCTYKEVRNYYKRHIGDTKIGMLLGAFGKPFLLNEVSWGMRIKHDFPQVFKKSFLESEIEVDE